MKDNFLLNKFKDNIYKYNLISTSRPILVAVSGGIDSTVMLHLLNGAIDKTKYEIIVVHVNHGMRGEEADLDEEFVSQLARNIEFKYESIKLSGISTQEEAREERFKYFLNVANKYKAENIFLAHHLDDLCETFCLRLIRGSGPWGLCSMSFNDAYENVSLCRPLLNISKEEILLYANENSIEYREDRSNNSDKYDRNKIRHHIIPLIKKELNPNFESTIKNTVLLLQEDEKYFSKKTESLFLDLCVSEEENRISLDLNKFQDNDPVLQKRLIRYALRKLKGNSLNVSFVNINDVLRITTSNEKRKQLMFADNIKVEKLNKHLIITV